MASSKTAKTIFKDAAGKIRSHPIQDLRPIRSKNMSKGIFAVVKHMIHLFSHVQNPPRRPPPPLSSKTQHARLITIKQSHYCEKGRWALDIAEADSKSPIWYTEDAHPPAFNSYATIDASKDQASITPMIVLEGENNGEGTKKEVLTKSDMLLQRFCPQLYPKEIKDDILAMEKDLHERLGTTIRVYLYHHMMTEDQYFKVLSDICSQGTSKVEALLFERLLKGGIEKGMRKVMKINDDSAKFSENEIEQLLSKELSNRLSSSSRQYLMDTPTHKYGFTAADLTLCALTFPLLRPSCMKEFTELQDSKLPPSVTEFSNKMRQTLAGKHVLKCYEKHRPKTTSNDGNDDMLVELKTMPRDRIPWIEMSVAMGVVSMVVAGGVRLFG